MGAWLPDQEGSLLEKLNDSAVRNGLFSPLHWTASQEGDVSVEEATALALQAFGRSSLQTTRVPLANAIIWLSLQRQSQRWSGIRGEENLVGAFTLSLANEPEGISPSSSVNVSSPGSSQLGTASWDGDYGVRSFETRGNKPAFLLSGGKGNIPAVLRVSYLER